MRFKNQLIVLAALSATLSVAFGAEDTGEQALAASTRTMLESVHTKLEKEFGETAGNGYSRVQRIQSHAVKDRSVFAAHDESGAWKITAFNLVGLTYSATPVVHLTPIPANQKEARLQKLVPIQKRDANTFEAAAMEKLQKGENVVARMNANHDIEMIGAIRATENCMSCHATVPRKDGDTTVNLNVKKGDLLGAFSYVLKRPEEAAMQVASRK